jgi:hypothetical protein
VLFPNATPRPGAAILGSAGPPGPGEGCISLFLERLSGHASDAGEEEDTGVQPPMRPVRAFFSMAVCHDAPLSSRVLCGHEDSERRKRYHVLSTCDGCGQYPLEERYKGTTMSDFDLCAKCYAKTCADARGKRGRSRSCSRSRSRSRSATGSPRAQSPYVGELIAQEKEDGDGADADALPGFVRIETPTSHVLTSEHIFAQPGCDWGWPEFISHAAAREFADANGGSLVLEAHVTVDHSTAFRAAHAA